MNCSICGKFCENGCKWEYAFPYVNYSCLVPVCKKCAAIETLKGGE